MSQSASQYSRILGHTQYPIPVSF